MPISYLIVLTTCSALCLILMVPGNAMLATIFTLGLAVPLLFLLPMMTILLWTLLPAVLSWRSPARWPLVGLGLVVPMLVLSLLPVLADRAAARHVAGVGRMQPARLAVTDAIGVTIIRDVQESDAPCFDLCEQLLTGGKVAWVRIVLRDDSFVNTPTQTQALFVAATGAACSDANPDLSANQPCVLFAPDHGKPADLTLELSNQLTLPKDQREGWPFFELRTRTAVAYRGKDPSDVIFVARQVVHDRPTVWIGIDPGSLANGDAGGGLVLLRQRSATAPIDLAAAFSAMDFPHGSVRTPLSKAAETEGNIFIAPPPGAQDAAFVSSMLAVGPEGAATFSNAFGQVVTRWHYQLRHRSELSAAEQTIFCRSLADTRVGQTPWSDKVIRKHDLTCP